MLKNKKEIFWTLMIIFLILLIILICIKIYFLLPNLNDTIFVSFIGFSGAILGGALTLIGVLMTIDANEKIRHKDELPQKIKRLEKAMDLFTNIFDNGFSKLDDDPYRTKPHFMRIDKEYELNSTEEYKYFTDLFLREIKEELLHADAETYRWFLNLKKDILKKDTELFLEVHRKLDKFKFNLVEKHEINIFDSEEVETIILNKEEEKELEELQIIVYEKDSEFLSELHKMYMDLYNKLYFKTEDTINKLDY
ncbi:hypothetical protein [Salipaludibacillus agaradhaerens]|uniref:hypothetical protein n=1 Tax=Salipaludibacillus agaradhaerens TaxID=76935 RepID=UPI000997BC50|nr:hypothetical protein [Salipaludibacillus agaradhaerens]